MHVHSIRELDWFLDWSYHVCPCYIHDKYLHAENDIRSTVGIDQDLWCYAKSMDSEDGSHHTAIAFYAWDFAGQASQIVTCWSLLHVIQEEYSTAHQCFITDNSLYVLCWRACDGEEGIHELKDWLLTIKVRQNCVIRMLDCMLEFVIMLLYMYFIYYYN